jgi:hypothetical protein
MEKELKSCTGCKKTFEYTKANFYSNGYDKNGNQRLKSKCKKCYDQHASTRLTDIITEHYGEYKCSVCGYDKCLNAIEFHHFNSGEKDFEVSKMSSFSKDKIVCELEKCLMLCANCHREIHAGVLSKEEACKKISVDDTLDEASMPPPPLFKRMIGWFI